MTLQVKLVLANLPDAVDAPRMLWLGGLSAGRHRGGSRATRVAHSGLNPEIFAPLP